MGEIEKIKYNQLDSYLKEVRSQGRYAFTLDELKNEFQIQYPAIKQRLHRLKYFRMTYCKNYW